MITIYNIFEEIIDPQNSEIEQKLLLLKRQRDFSKYKILKSLNQSINMKQSLGDISSRADAIQSAMQQKISPKTNLLTSRNDFIRERLKTLSNALKAGRISQTEFKRQTDEFRKQRNGIGAEGKTAGQYI